MSVIGIVCEYNPFHKGHMLHINEIRHAFGQDSTVVCAMSGDYVQRGEPAIYSKFARAEAACRCGADLVIELPLPWCLSSAEGFARGAVGLLDALGAEYLSFGSEAGELEPLERISHTLIEPELTAEIKQLMATQTNISFAAARQIALEARLGGTARLIEEPNNILAVEYLKAIYQQNSSLKPHTVKRTGAGHDTRGRGEIKSASELRSIIRSGDIEKASASIPEEAEAVFSRERALGRVLSCERFEAALMARLRLISKESCAALPDAGDGLENKLWKAAREEQSLDALLSAVKSKRYAMARVRRMCMCAALGIDAQMSEGMPGYARVLASNEKGFAVLKECTDNESVKIISKPAHAHEMSAKERKVFELTAQAHDLYTLSFTAESERKGGNDWRNSPFIVKNS